MGKFGPEADFNPLHAASESCRAQRFGLAIEISAKVARALCSVLTFKRLQRLPRARSAPVARLEIVREALQRKREQVPISKQFAQARLRLG